MLYTFFDRLPFSKKEDNEIRKSERCCPLDWYLFITQEGWFKYLWEKIEGTTGCRYQASRKAESILRWRQTWKHEINAHAHEDRWIYSFQNMLSWFSLNDLNDQEVFKEPHTRQTWKHEINAHAHEDRWICSFQNMLSWFSLNDLNDQEVFKGPAEICYWSKMLL